MLAVFGNNGINLDQIRSNPHYLRIVVFRRILLLRRCGWCRRRRGLGQWLLPAQIERNGKQQDQADRKMFIHCFKSSAYASQRHRRQMKVRLRFITSSKVDSSDSNLAIVAPAQIMIGRAA